MKDNYLSEEEIIENFINYIDSSIYDYAVMLDGEWGSGKTFFVKEKLVPAIENREEKLQEDNPDYQKRKVLYVSLYGITDTSEISRLLYVELSHSIDALNERTKSSTGKKIMSWIGVGTKIISDVVRDVGGVNLESAFEKIASNFSLNKYILIFDDLERTSCNINDVLGYINNFVEHDGIKVLLIANEAEINTVSQLENNPDELMVCLQQNLDFQDEENNNGRNTQKGISNGKISLNRLMKRVDLLFERNQAYRRIKEKIVGETIKYHPDFEALISSLIELHIKEDEALYRILMLKKQRLLDIANYYKHYNLRTFLFFLSKLITIRECLNEHLDIVERITDYCFAVSIRFKEGRAIDEWENGSQVGTRAIFDSMDFRNYGLAFKFIDDFIQFGRVNRKEIVKNVEQYIVYEQKSAKLEDDPVNKLRNWWEMDEQKVHVLMKSLIENLQENKYSFKLYPEILNSFASLVSIGFSQEYMDKLFETMKKNIEDAEGDVSLLYRYTSFLGETDKAIFQEKMEELNSLVQTKENRKKDELLVQMLKDPQTWGEKISEYVAMKSRGPIEDRQFIYKLDINRVLRNIEISDARNIELFRYALSDVYSFGNIVDFYASDYPNLLKLYEGIDPENEEYDLIKRKVVKWLKDLIGKKLALLKPEGDRPNVVEESKDFTT